MASTAVVKKGAAPTRRRGKVVNIDAALEENHPGWREEEVPTVPVEVLGEVFDMLTVINVFNLMALDDEDDMAALQKLLLYQVVPEQRSRMRGLMSRQTNLKAEVFGEIVTKALEAIAEGVPSQRPSASGSSAKRKAVTSRSADD